MSNLYPVSLVSVGVKVGLSLLSSCELGRASTKHPQPRISGYSFLSRCNRGLKSYVNKYIYHIYIYIYIYINKINIAQIK